MCDQLPGNKQIIPGQKYLGHYIAFISVILQVIFGAEIIKAVCFGSVGVRLETVPAVFVNDRIAFTDKLKAEIPAGFHDKPALGWLKQAEQVHECSFTATDRSAEQDAFSKIYSQLGSHRLIFQEIRQEPV